MSFASRYATIPHDARAHLLACVTPHGFVAATEDRSNYRRVWSRDGVICGLAALACHVADPDASDTRALIRALDHTIETLARDQSPTGSLPSNVKPAPFGIADVSYGRRVGRVDSTLWFMIGVCAAGRLAGRDDRVDRFWRHLERADRVLCAWEFNDGGLLYVPMGGDWADEYILHGYLLYDQALRLWAMREWAAAARRVGRPAGHLEERVTALHQRIVAEFAIGDRPGFLAGFNPGEQYDAFDAFGNALCLLLEVGNAERRRAAVSYAARIAHRDLVPAFHPEIPRDTAAYTRLERMAAYHFRNLPGRYHNGGLWPMVNAFWVLGAHNNGAAGLARRLTVGIHRANSGARPFPEYIDAHTGEPGGADGQAWSAAASILADAAGRGFAKLLSPPPER